MSQVAEDTLQAGREAAERHAWPEAFQHLKGADSDGALESAEDLERFGEAAWWTAHAEESVDALERSFKTHRQAGDRRAAARLALKLAREHFDRVAVTVGAAWLARATRLLEGEPESPEQGFLEAVRAAMTGARGDLEGALAMAERALEIGMRTGDADVQAFALAAQGWIRVAMGQRQEGLALMDEATVAAVSGEVSPRVTGDIYCGTISTCRDLGDYRRASDWTEAAERWCQRQSISGFPGICRVYRAEIIRLRGAWAEAEQEARKACDELRRFGLFFYEGSGFNEVGEIRLRLGDLDGAEDAFRHAHALGRDPQPGLALLRLAEGDIESAAAGIQRALDGQRSDRLARARLLPAQAEIALAAGDQETAKEAAAELEEVADIYETAPLRASALSARGTLQLNEGDPQSAVGTLRRAWALWQEVDLPYEAARTRVDLASAYRALGDDEAAVLELEVARSAFERLGAAPALRRVEGLLEAAGKGRAPAVAVRSSRVTKTFMFTDVVGSTPLLEALGDDAWQELLAWHDRTLRALFARHDGQEIDHAGDGFFVAFDDPAAAVESAVAIQRRLAEHRREHGFSPQVRIGLHTADVTLRGRKYTGKGVHAARRVADVAGGEEIISTAKTLKGVAPRYPLGEPRTVRLKGISGEVSVVGVDWR